MRRKGSVIKPLSVSRNSEAEDSRFRRHVEFDAVRILEALGGPAELREIFARRSMLVADSTSRSWRTRKQVPVSFIPTLLDELEHRGHDWREFVVDAGADRQWRT